MPRRVWLLLVPLVPLVLGLIFTAGSVLGSNLAQSVLQPYPTLPLTPAAGPPAGPQTPLTPTMFGLDQGTVLLAGVILILLILLALVLISKDGTWTTA